MANKNWLVIGLIILGIYLLYSSGTLGGIFGRGDIDLDLPPSDKKTSITLNTKSALHEPALNANISYYIFTDSGEFYKEGTTSTGTVSFDVDSGTSSVSRSWTLITYDDDDSGDDYYPEELTFTTGTESLKTINLLTYKEGSAEVKSVLDPVDNDHNITTAQGSVEGISVYWKVNETDCGYMNPIFVLEANDTEVDDIRCPGLSAYNCPSKIVDPASEQFELWCYQKEGMFTSEMSSSATSTECNVEFSSSVSAATTISNITVTMIDESMYKEDAYITLGKDAFVIGSYDPGDNTDIGDTVEATGVGIWFSG